MYVELALNDKNYEPTYTGPIPPSNGSFATPAQRDEPESKGVRSN